MHDRSLDDALRRNDPALHDLRSGRRRGAGFADVVVVGQAGQRLPARSNSLAASVALHALVRRGAERREGAALAALEPGADRRRREGVLCRQRRGDGARDGTRAGWYSKRRCQPRIAFFLLSACTLRFLLLVLQTPRDGFIVLHGVKTRGHTAATRARRLTLLRFRSDSVDVWPRYVSRTYRIASMLQ